MPFSEMVKDQAYARSSGQCECRRNHNAHLLRRCDARFSRYGGQWDAHHVTASGVGGADTLSNCEALCLACHKLTDSFGRG
jgi:hypothetical protein